MSISEQKKPIEMKLCKILDDFIIKNNLPYKLSTEIITDKRQIGLLSKRDEKTGRLEFLKVINNE